MIPFISSLDVIQKLEAQVKGLIKRQEELECSVKVTVHLMRGKVARYFRQHQLQRLQVGGEAH